VIFRETPLAGAYVIEPEPREDDRGFFARVWCDAEFAAHGLDTKIAQSSISWNRRRGTLRGMHFQGPPHEEVKLVRCIRGALYDVIIDLRPASPTFTQHVAVELNAENRRALYIPRGFSHGFQTLEDDTEVLYQISEPYAPGSARGVRFDDPAFGITWPVRNPIMHERDRYYPDFPHTTCAVS
jgi:dTDP-4-dehydrorhamnose 3,5-epimerase